MNSKEDGSEIDTSIKWSSLKQSQLNSLHLFSNNEDSTTFNQNMHGFETSE